MPNLPPGFFPLDRECWACHHYGFKDREPGDNEKGLAYCGHFKKHFLHQLEQPDANGEIHKPAGLRTCKEWIQKGTV